MSASFIPATSGHQPLLPASRSSGDEQSPPARSHRPRHIPNALHVFSRVSLGPVPGGSNEPRRFLQQLLGSLRHLGHNLNSSKGWGRETLGKEGLEVTHAWRKAGRLRTTSYMVPEPISAPLCPLCHHPLLPAGWGSLLPTENRLITHCQGIGDAFQHGDTVTGQGAQPAALGNSSPQKGSHKHQKQ